MEYRILGKTGLKISRMGFGGIPIQKIDAEGTKPLIKRLLEKGVNYIDTARGYTVSEEYLGIALANTINLISPRAVVLEGRILSAPKNQERMIRIVEQYMFHIHSGMIDFTFLPYDPDRGARAAAAVVVREFLGKPV